MSIAIEVTRYDSSDYDNKYYQSISINDEDKTRIDGITKTHLYNVRATSEEGSEIIKKVLSIRKKDTSRKRQGLLAYIVGNFAIDDTYLTNSYFNINLSIPAVKKIMKKMKKEGTKVQDLFKRRTYIKRDTFLKRYKINAHVKSIPYINYSDNICDNNCVYDYVMKTYTKTAVKKQKEIFNKSDSNTVDNINQFCEYYKIPLTLYNIAGKIITKNNYNSTQNNRNHKAFIAILANNHLYPFCGNPGSSTVPKLNIETRLEPTGEDYKNNSNNITIEINNRVYSRSGYYECEISQTELDNTFFDRLHPNFSYACEENIKMKSVLFKSKKLNNNVIYEVDMNRAFYSTAYKFIKSTESYPVFTVENHFEKYSNEPIKDIDYYLISKDAIMKLKLIGIYNNLLDGKMVNMLIEHNLLKTSDIEYTKKPQYMGTWSSVIKRINKLSENYEGDLSKDYVIYNGVLGRLINSKTFVIHGISSEDGNLLNTDGKEEWVGGDSFVDEYENENEPYSTYSKTSTSYRYINTVNIYNMIISRCNYKMIKALIKIKQSNPDAKLLKIWVDSLCFDRKISVPHSVKKNFKILSSIDELITKYHKVKDNKIEIPKSSIYHKLSIQYIDGNEIINKYEGELDVYNKNESFIGPPGCGKTYKITHEYDYDYATTVSNICALNISTDKIKGETLYSLFGLYNINKYSETFKKFYEKVIWIDEYSMANSYFHNYFFILSKIYNTKFIISGDHNQIGPVRDKKIDPERLYYNKFMNTITEISDDHEHSRNDRDIKIIRTKVLDGYLNPSPENYKELYNFFRINQSKKDYTTIKRHLCYTRKTRWNINNIIMAKNKYVFDFIYNETTQKYVKINGLDIKISDLDKNDYKKKDVFEKTTKEVIDCNVSNGVILSAKLKVSETGINKNEIYEVIEKVENGYILKNLLDNSEKYFEKTFLKDFELGFCNTIHSCQGLTISDDVAIHEVKMQIYKDLSILYTGITRAKRYSQLHFYYDYHQFQNVKDYSNKLYFNDDGEEYQQFDEVKCAK